MMEFRFSLVLTLCLLLLCVGSTVHLGLCAENPTEPVKRESYHPHVDEHFDVKYHKQRLDERLAAGGSDEDVQAAQRRYNAAREHAHRQQLIAKYAKKAAEDSLSKTEL
mmetsp:Transcript_7843/g.14228  ORF Transcript_7843/g.14228 Transcript_7843/m.14228 type:complete len:109 (-) Transcript_7843:1890-2216(-)